MTTTMNELVVRVLHELTEGNNRMSWMTVYNLAIKKGEKPNYARFLADEYSHLNGLDRDTQPELPGR